jgi:hypothetical protein
MDEQGARALLDQVSATPAPPSAVDIGLARRRGRSRLRRRRWGTALAPVVAAAAVAGIVLGTGALTSGTGGGHHGSPRPVSPIVPPHRFNPLRPYATFGWLPPGVPHAADITQSLPTEQSVLTGSLQTGEYLLTVWAPGTCDRDPAQLARALQHHRHPQLNCMQTPSSGSLVQVISQAPPVRGRPAFWMRGRLLAWEYAPHAWVTLQVYRLGAPAPAAAIRHRVATSVRYGDPNAPGPRFPYQLTGIPASWQVTSVHWKAKNLLGKDLSAGLIGQLLVTPGKGKCWLAPGSQPVTLNGVKAVLTVFHQPGARSYQALCVPESSGLSVQFLLFRAHGEHGYPFGGAAQLFLHHLHLLGPDPANWTSHPLG